MAGVELSFSLYFVGLLFLNGISYKLYVGILCSAIVFVLIAVLVTSVVTWRHGYKKRIAVRQVAGRAEKGLTTPTTSSASSTRHHHSAQELQHMCSIHALPSQPLPLCGCGNVGCLECTSAQPRVVVICGQLSSASCCNLSVPVVSNSAYQVESPSGHEVALKTNLAYTLPQNQAPPLAPPPPPYPGTSKVESVHEYDYITARN